MIWPVFESAGVSPGTSPVIHFLSCHCFCSWIANRYRLLNKNNILNWQAKVFAFMINVFGHNVLLSVHDNVLSAGYECDASLLFPQRYNSLSAEVVFYRLFLLDYLSLLLYLLLQKSKDTREQCRVQNITNKEELCKRFKRKTNCVKNEEK